MAGCKIRLTSQRASLSDLNPFIQKLDTVVANSWLTTRMSCVSEAVKKSCSDNQSIKLDKLVTIPNGIDIERYKPVDSRDKSSNTIRALCVARFHEQKGHYYLLKAISELPEDVNFELDLYGDGELEENLKSLVAEMGLGEKVSFKGRSSEIYSIMPSYDMLILPSLWEGMPNVVLEAMASGLPVIATAVDGTVELVDDGLTGFLVEPRSEKAILNALIKMLSSEEKRLSMGKAGRKLAEERFDEKKVISSHFRLYHELIGRS